jgi:hypothetical protein
MLDASTIRIRVLTSCTGEKAFAPANALVRTDFESSAEHIAKREADLAAYRRPAGSLYTGRQHVHLMRGVYAAREAGLNVDVCILSAGYGLIAENRMIAPYECTFAGQPKREIQRWARELRIPAAVRQWCAEDSDLALVLLGDDYQTAANLSKDVCFGATTLFFCGTVAARTLSDWPNVRKIPLSRALARQYGQGLVWLKGYLAERILLRLAREPRMLDSLQDPNAHVLNIISSGSQQLNLLQ